MYGVIINIQHTIIKIWSYNKMASIQNVFISLENGLTLHTILLGQHIIHYWKAKNIPFHVVSNTMICNLHGMIQTLKKLCKYGLREIGCFFKKVSFFV